MTLLHKRSTPSLVSVSSWDLIGDQTSIYWTIDELGHPEEPLIHQTMSRNRFQQIDRFLHLVEPRREGEILRPWEYIEPLSDILQGSFRRCGSPGTNVTVDECVLRCLGRCADIVTVPNKPTPKGLKIWVFAAGGYVWSWLFHTKLHEEGTSGLDPRRSELNKTQAVVPILLTRTLGFGGYRHVVWLDNLFTSVELISMLRRLGYGCCGTLRNDARDWRL